MKPKSLFETGTYSSDWIRDFYDQAGVWWGAESDDPAEEQARADALERLCGPGVKRVLELGAGSGWAAAAMAERGHHVTAVELSHVHVLQARELLNTSRKGTLEIIEGDFYTVALDGKFDAVCCWDGFGVGTDADHRRLLRRIAQEWLTPAGCVLIDVASTAWAARHAGEEEHLKRLEGVPGSVAMVRRWHFDPLHSRWIDEWQPADDPAQARAQTVRTYTPADFRLLLEGTGLALKRIEVDGHGLDLEGERITTTGPLSDAYSYLVMLGLSK